MWRTRFLWVYLQLEILWDTCYTDAEIRFALAMLPEGLEDTYGHCLERINNTDNRAFKVLKWVSFATSPLHIEELREAIAFDPQDTAWNAENIPRKEFVIGCCANLVVVDPTDNRVRFAHSSVKQYLEKVRGKNIIQDYPTPAQGVLECGELCVAYLSFSDFNLQISTRKNENAALDVPSPMLFAQEALPGLFTRRFFQRRYDQNRSVSMAFRGIRTASAPDRTRYKFLDYAIANWAFQTKQISRTSPFWNKFEQLAMCFNETWNFHPWIPSGRSASSWLHGILGWAVMEQHAPLLSVVQTAGPSLQVICDLPLIGQGLPALHVAAKLGNQEIFKILLGFCKVNVPDLEGYTVLHHAASGGHIEICQFLLWSKKVDMNARSKLSCTPLISAAKNGHEEVVKMLLERGADFEAKDDKSRTPIWWAAEKSHDGVVKLLLEKGADFEVRDSRGETPLLLAIEKGHGIVVELLLERGVDFENKVQKDHTLLSWAAINGQEAVVRLLLKRGANHKAKDTRGRTPLLLAAANGHAAVIEELLARGADFKARDTDLRSPLSWAAMGGHEAVVNLLLKKGAYLEARDSRLRTPLLGAAMEGHETAVKLLLEKGADFKVKDSESRTPLLWAALKGHEAIVKLLLDKGADIETKDARSSRTPLSWAAENGHWALVKMLLERGAVNSDGHVIPS